MVTASAGERGRSQEAGTPRGATIARLTPRVAVTILDLVPLAVLLALMAVLRAQDQPTTVVLGVGIAATVLGFGWLVFLWWGYATRGQGPAATWLGIRVLRLSDGKPLGWSRWLLRELVWYASMILPVVWLLLVITMVIQPRRRGWHDLVGQSVVVHAGTAAPASDARPGQLATFAAEDTVALPDHYLETEALYAPVEVSPLDAGVPRSVEPITALPTFSASAAVPARPSAPAPASGTAMSWAEWTAEGPVQQSAYLEQIPYNAPAAYPYAARDALTQTHRPQAAHATLPQPAPVTQPMIVAEDEDMARTHLVPVDKGPVAPRSATDGWQLRLDDGRTVSVRGLVLIGRNPQARPDEQADLVQTGIENRMVSKTHLAVGIDDAGLYVMDRGSTNGTAIANSDGEFEPCAPGDVVHVGEGQIVYFGDRHLEVRRWPRRGSNRVTHR